MRRFLDSRGQAAVEFFFVLLGTLLILGLMVTLFSFAQGVFRETTRARAEMLQAFHDARQYKVDGGTVYRPKSPIRVALRQLPFVGGLVSGVPPFERSVSLTGGAAPPMIFWGAAEECAGAALLVGTQTRARGIKPGAEIGAAVALATCLEFHALEFR